MAFHPAALASERWLTFPSGQTEGREAYVTALNEHLTQAGLARAQVIEVDSLTAQNRLAEAGAGLAFVPVTSIEEELRAGSLQVLELARPGPAIPVVLVRRPGGFESAATRALADALRSQLQPVDRGQPR
jgi:DNA-binding transcriptional LysR family regulator